MTGHLRSRGATIAPIAPPVPDDPRFRTMADCAPVLLWMTGTDGECVFFNQVWLDFTGRPLEREIGVGWAEGVHPEDLQACMDGFLEGFVARREFRLEYRLRRHDGVYRWLLDTGRPWYLQDGTFAGFIGSCIDVSDMKAAQATLVSANAELRDSVRQKDALVGEVHHRVKNNLQLILSLIRWNARNLGDERLHGFSMDMHRRIFSIALIHERIYRSRDFSRVDLGAYTRELCDHLGNAHGSERVTIRCQAEHLEADLDVAVPFGLLVTEVVANAFKHAFVDGRAGHVAVSLEQRADAARLTVADDGVGLATNPTAPAGFGLDLVKTLARQLAGELRFDVERGTRVTFAFQPGAPS